MSHFLYHGFFRNIFSEIKLLFLLLRKPWEIYPRFCTGISFSNCVMKSVCWRNAFVFFFRKMCGFLVQSVVYFYIYIFQVDETALLTNVLYALTLKLFFQTEYRRPNQIVCLLVVMSRPVEFKERSYFISFDLLILFQEMFCLINTPLEQSSDCVK